MIISGRFGLMGLALAACIALSLLADGASAQGTNTCGDRTMCDERNNRFGCCDNGGNCTWYAEYHAQCVWGHPGLGCTGNATEWTKCSGYAATGALVGSIFVVTAITDNDRGHVGAVVKVVEENGSYDTQEQACDGQYGTFSATRDSKFASGFIPVTDTNNSGYVDQDPEDDTPLPTSYSGSYSITLRNTGTKTWPDTYQLKLTSNLGGFTSEPATVPVNTRVAPSEAHTFSWTMTTPSTPGDKRRTFWRMIDEDGNEFGTSAFISIDVLARSSQGDACTDTMWCASGLTCVDGRCCNASSCPSCQRCNVPGHLGTCAPDPYGYDDSAEVCTACDAFGNPLMTTDDPSCGTIDCDLLDTACRDYHDLTANRCEGMGDCKDANTSDCNSYSKAPTGTECRAQSCSGGVVHRADTCDEYGHCREGGSYTCPSNGVCEGVCAGSACGYRSTQVCTRCSGSGTALAESDDAGCGTIDCDGLDRLCRNYHDLTSDRCEGMGNCKDANSSDCVSYSNWSSGSQCRAQTCYNGVVQRADTCDGYGSCIDRGSYTCSGNYNCNGSACRTSCTYTSHCRSGYYCSAGRCYGGISGAESSTDGSTSEGASEPMPPADGDMDGFDYDVDCDDTNPGVHPGAPEVLGDGVDDNCGDVE